MLPLKLQELHHGMTGITKDLGKFLAEAGSICLDTQGHISTVQFNLKGYKINVYDLSWVPVTEQLRRSYNDMSEATEYGAMGIAALLIKKELGLEVVNRSRKGTGFDYWLGNSVANPPFLHQARLEVSGILKGDNASIKKRVRQKLEQVGKYNASYSLLPAYVIVVEFSAPCAEVRKQ